MQVFRKFNNLVLAQKSFLLIALIFLLSSCGGKAPEPPKAPLGIPYQVHERLTITILNSRQIAASDVPLLGPPPANKKYLAVRFLLTNPGKNRGVKPSTLQEIIGYMSLTGSQIGKPINVSYENLSESLEKFTYSAAGISKSPINPGESRDGWIVIQVPLNSYAPFTLTLYPKENIGNSRIMKVDLT